MSKRVLKRFRWCGSLRVGAGFERLRDLGVRFIQEPTGMGPVTTAVLDDTCGNLIQIHSKQGG